jgi:CubicO group peptidase (beta-lactamase class C family)
MKPMAIRLALAMVACNLAAWCAPSAMADIVFDNLDQPVVGTDGPTVTNAGNKFTTGGVAERIDDIALLLRDTGGSLTDVGLYSSVGGVPGLELVSFGSVTPTLAGDHAYALLPSATFIMDADTQYYLIATYSGNSVYDYTKSLTYSGSASDDGFAESVDGGATWVLYAPTSGPYQMRIDASAVPEPSSVVLLGVGVGALGLCKFTRRGTRARAIGGGNGRATAGAGVVPPAAGSPETIAKIGEAAALAFLLAVALAPLVRAQDARTLRKGEAAQVGLDPERLDAALRLVEESVRSGRASGAVVLVARRGVVVAERAFGVLDPISRRPHTMETIYPIASISKPIAATAAMILVDEGKLGLNDPVERYLPAFKEQKFKTPAGDLVHRPFTVRHLLTHTSGLPSNSPLRKLPYREWLSLPLRETIDATAKVDLEYEPGTKTKYSAVGFATLGRVVEVVSGRPFEAFVAERVFEPLGMRNSYYNVPKPLADRVAPGFFFRMIDGKFDGIDPPDPDFKIVNTMPNAGAFSTARDLVVFYQMFLNGGTYGGRRLLSPATVRMMVADQTPGLPDRWGLSWMLGAGRRDAGVPICSPETFGHFGTAGSERCLAWADPREDLIGIILTQGADLGPLGDLLTRFQHMVHAALDDPQATNTIGDKVTTGGRRGRGNEE